MKKKKYLIARTDKTGEVALVRDYNDGTGQVVDVGPEEQISRLRDALERRSG